MRIDVWDIPKVKAEATTHIDCGYSRQFDELFTIEKEIGKGGFGTVRVVKEKATGEVYACKSVSKSLNIPNLAADKQAQHIDNIEREIKILKKLRGTLSVVHFKGAYEDNEHIHIVMEYCRGGELDHQVGRRLYTEEMVAGYMRAVLHTLAQCHSHHILHRDIKPGNFMLLSEAEDSPLKAIDFGLGVFYDPKELPRGDLGLEGTPWFMAPEVLSSQVYPESDLWAAGVMAYQLLSGYLPFDDVRNPGNPALSVIWKGILTEEPSFRRAAWKEVSEEAQDFVKVLLNKDYTKRPPAKELLRHAWLQKSFHVKNKRRPLSGTVVQRIQRFAQSNVVRRTILDFIAMELLKMMPPELSPAYGGSFHGQMRASDLVNIGGTPNAAGLEDSIPGSSPKDDSSQNSEPVSISDVFPMSPERVGVLGIPIPGSDQGLGRRSSFEGSGHGSGHGGASFGLLGRRGMLPEGSGHGGSFSRRPSLLARSPSVRQMAALAAAAEKHGATVHGPSDYWRVMRAASELAAMESGHGQTNYLHTAPRTEQERQEQRKVARLTLDTSVHGGSRFEALLKQFDSEQKFHKPPGGGGMRAVQSMGALHTMSSSAPVKSGGLSMAVAAQQAEARQKQEHPIFPPLNVVSEAAAEKRQPMEVEERGHGGMSAFALLSQAGAAPAQPIEVTEKAGGAPITVKRVGFKNVGGSNTNSPPTAMDVDSAAARSTAPSAQPQEGKTIQEKAAQALRASNPSSSVTGAVTTPQDLEALMRRLQFKQDTQSMSKEAFADALNKLGYDLAPTEVSILLDQLDLDADKSVEASAFVASQLDWEALQKDNRELWLECAQRAFADLDTNSDGRLTVADLINSLRSKLPATEVDYAVEDALIEAGQADADDIDFEGFLKMIRVGSHDALSSLDQYDPRIRSNHFDGDYSVHGTRLPTVAEDDKPAAG